MCNFKVGSLTVPLSPQLETKMRSEIKSEYAQPALTTDEITLKKAREDYEVNKSKRRKLEESCFKVIIISSMMAMYESQFRTTAQSFRMSNKLITN